MNNLNTGFLSNGYDGAYEAPLSLAPTTPTTLWTDENHSIGKTTKRLLTSENNKEKLYGLLTGKELYILAHARWDSDKRTIEQFVGILNRLLAWGYFNDPNTTVVGLQYPYPGCNPWSFGYGNIPKNMMERPEHHIPMPKIGDAWINETKPSPTPEPDTEESAADDVPQKKIIAEQTPFGPIYKTVESNGNENKKRKKTGTTDQTTDSETKK